MDYCFMNAKLIVDKKKHEYYISRDSCEYFKTHNVASTYCTEAALELESREVPKAYTSFQMVYNITCFIAISCIQLI